MWVCHESGGCPPCNRVCNTAFALTPPPPVTVELTTSTPGLAAVKASNNACSAFDSPGEVHQEKISNASSACAAARRDPICPRPTAPIPSAAPPLRTPRRDARDPNLLEKSSTGYSFSIAERRPCAIAQPPRTSRQRSLGTEGRPPRTPTSLRDLRHVPGLYMASSLPSTSYSLADRRRAEHFIQRLDEEVLAPHHAFVDAQVLALVVTAMLEDPFPARRVHCQELRREKRVQNRPGVLLVVRGPLRFPRQLGEL